MLFSSLDDRTDRELQFGNNLDRTYERDDLLPGIPIRKGFPPDER